MHVVNVGMRWPEEVEKNVKLVESSKPTMDISQLPRQTAGIYRAEDDEIGP